MRSRFILFTLVSALAFCADASVISPQEALIRLNLSAPTRAKAAMAGAQGSRLVYTEYASGEPTSYVFDLGASGSGYMVLSADDAAAPLLGYSDGAAFDPNNIPPNMQYWLGEYSRQIEWARSHSIGAYRQKAASDFSPIAPMVTTKWDQDSPYNNLCPTYNNQRCVTGCVATAMAQVMKYHEWPAKGTGSHSYYATTIRQTLSMDFASTTFDWAKMLNSYTSSATSAQTTAVATLMKACGVSVDMDYSPNGSGAQSSNVVTALINYFGYDKGIHSADREYYNYGDWQKLIYDELKTNGPVFLSGLNSEGGHAFVCDGYSSDGYFHINWGWGGMSDGYFLMQALDPDSQGIGGSTDGYSQGLSAIVGVRKAQEGSEYYKNIVCINDFGISPSMASLGSYIKVSGFFANSSAITLSGTLGIKITSDSNGESKYVGFDFSDLQPNTGYTEFGVALPYSLSAGKYTVVPAWKPTGEAWRDVPVSIMRTQYVIMEVSGTTATFSTPAPASIKAEDFKVNSLVYNNTRFNVSATLVNNSSEEYLGAIQVALYKTTSQPAAGKKPSYFTPEQNVDLAPGASMPLDLTSYFQYYTNNPLTAGNYNMYIIDRNYAPISEPISVSVGTLTTQTSISLGKIRVSKGSATNVDPMDINFEIDVTCNAGYYADCLDMYVYPKTASVVSGYLTSTYGFASPGETVTLKFKGSVPALPYNTDCIAMINFNNDWVSSTMLEFRTGSEQKYTLDFTPLTLTSGDVQSVDPSSVSFATTAQCADGSYDGDVAVRIYTSAGSFVSSLSSSLSISKGESRELTFTGSIPNATAGAEYYAVVYCDGSTFDASRLSFKVTSDVDLWVDGVSLTSPVEMHTTIKSSFTVRNRSSISSSGSIVGALFAQDGGEPLFKANSTASFSLKGGASKFLYYNMNFNDAPAGEYIVKYLVAETGNVVSAGYPLVILDDGSGIYDIDADGCGVKQVMLFDLRGAEIKALNPAPGHYIRVVVNADGSTKTDHVIIK